MEDSIVKEEVKQMKEKDKEDAKFFDAADEVKQ